jgi:hypothetical protein
MTNRGTWPGGATTAPRSSLLAFWLAGLALVTLVAALSGRWTRPGGAWIGCWVGWAIAGIVAAVYVPEAAYLFIVPALVAGTTGLTRAVRLVAPLLPPAVAAMLIMPSAWVLFDAIGTAALPVTGTALGLIATTLAPSIAATGASRWLLPAAFAAGSAVLLAVAGSTAPFSIDRPERMNLTFLQGDNAEAQWVIAPQSGELPDAMRGAARFGSTREQALPWSTGLGFIAPAAALPLDGPALQILEQHRGTGDRSLRLRARSLRGAPMLTLVLPPDRIASVSLNGFEFPKSVSVPGAMGRAYTCYAMPAEGIEFAIRLNGESPVEGYLIDRSSGLPEAGQTLIRARPREAVPSATGDVTIVYARVRF